jgi:tight adherence protein B
VGVLVVGLAGLGDVVLGAARRATLRERAMGAPERARSGRIVERLERSFARSRFGRDLELKLQAGAVHLTPLRFTLAALGLGILGYAIFSLKFGTVLALAGGLLSVRAAWWWLGRKVGQRNERFAAQLPELARVLANAASAGLSIVGALEIAAQELDAPASTELGVALEEVRIGQSFDRAFENLAERMPSRELGVLVSTLVIQQRAGGDLVHALAEMAGTLEARKDTLREVKTIMSGAVASAYVVAAMGVGTIFIFDGIRPGAIDELTHSTIGLLVLFLAAGLYTVGIVLIGRITKVQT